MRDVFKSSFLQTMRTSMYSNSERLRYETVRVFYGTDRAANNTSYLPARYGADRVPNGNVLVGYCDVAVPHDRKLGSLHSSSWLRFLNKNSPEYWVTLLDLKQLDVDTFFDSANQELRKAPGREVFVFIHGYNTSFEDAARRTAQLAYDLKFPGVPFFFSWPSRASYADYPADENAAEWAIPHVQQFLEAVSQRTKASAIHIIAHSMGNRVLARTLERMSSTPGNKARFRNIVLAAPDIDRDVFGQLASAIQVRAARVTIYASSKDKALALSRRFHGGLPRLGDNLPSLFTFRGIDSIDVSAVDTSFDGHSYFGDNDSVVSDLFYLIRGQSADRRARLRKISMPSGDGWFFQP